VSSTNPVTVYTMGMGDAAGINTGELNAMMTNGGSGQTTAPIAANQTDIEAAFADIVSRTVKFEVCNNADDNCNGIVDDGPGVCQNCVPFPEICNGLDDDCDGTKDNKLTDTGKTCGSSVGVCMPGTTVCQNAGTPTATLICQGGNNGIATD